MRLVGFGPHDHSGIGHARQPRQLLPDAHQRHGIEIGAFLDLAGNGHGQWYRVTATASDSPKPTRMQNQKSPRRAPQPSNGRILTVPPLFREPEFFPVLILARLL